MASSASLRRSATIAASLSPQLASRCRRTAFPTGRSQPWRSRCETPLTGPRGTLDR